MTVNKTPKWTALLIDAAKLKIGEFFTLQISEAIIGQFRAILRVSGRTMRWRWSVTKVFVAKNGIGEWRVKKVGLWR